MIFELELKSICEEFIKVLSDLKRREKISDEELNTHLKNKLIFLKRFEEDVV